MTKFNSEQQVLIDAPLDQKVVGIALAGSGKTTTILERTKRILTEYKTGNVLMISFTRMAANDIRKKLRRVISEDQLRRVQVGTFHSIIGKLIRNHAVAVGLEPSFSVIDENSTTTMYQSIVEADAVRRSDRACDQQHHYHHHLADGRRRNLLRGRAGACAGDGQRDQRGRAASGAVAGVWRGLGGGFRRMGHGALELAQDDADSSADHLGGVVPDCVFCPLDAA